MTALQTALTLDLRSADRQRTDPRLLRLAERIRQAAARTDLCAPEVFDPNVYPNANLVAAYFDAPDPANRAIKRYEDACTQTSPEADSMLAELFCCHEILHIWQEQPVRAPKSCRIRLYNIEDDVARFGENDLDRFDTNVLTDNAAETNDVDFLDERPIRSETADQTPTNLYPFFYSDSPAQNAENEEPPLDEPPVQVRSTVKKIGKAIESLLLTLLIFALLLWLVPIAKERLEKKFQQTAETSPTPTENFTRQAPSPTSPSTPPSTLPSTPMVPIAESYTSTSPADSLTLTPNTPSRRAALTIPPKNNDVFRQ